MERATFTLNEGSIPRLRRLAAEESLRTGRQVSASQLVRLALDQFMKDAPVSRGASSDAGRQL